VYVVIIDVFENNNTSIAAIRSVEADVFENVCTIIVPTLIVIAVVFGNVYRRIAAIPILFVVCELLALCELRVAYKADAN
jgi:hypothetical protein